MTSSPANQRLSADDHIEIGQLYMKYAAAIDFRDVDLWISLWADDSPSLVTHTGSVIDGRDALLESAVRHTANRAEAGYHFITNLLVEPAGEGALGTCYLMQVFPEQGEELTTYAGLPQGRLRYVLYYRDDLVRQAGRWLFRRRTANLIEA